MVNYGPGYKSCIVPSCNNCKKYNASKVFLLVPQNKVRRKQWLEAVGFKEYRSEKTNLYVCEDHFNLEEDLANYLPHKLMGYQRKLKPDVIPHKFDCCKSETKTDTANATLASKEINTTQENTQIVKNEVCNDSTMEFYDNIEIKEEILELPKQMKIENEALHENKTNSVTQESFTNKIEFVEVSNNDVTNFYNESTDIQTNLNILGSDKNVIKKKHKETNFYNELIDFQRNSKILSSDKEIKNNNNETNLCNVNVSIVNQNNSEILGSDKTVIKSEPEDIRFKSVRNAFICEPCSKSFPNKSNLDRHLKNSIRCKQRLSANRHLPVAPILVSLPQSQPQYQLLVLDSTSQLLFQT